MRCLLLLACVALGLGCVGTAQAPSVLGTLRLVPSDAIASLPTSSTSYGDRRYRDATAVDYSRPGFAVVYLDGGPSPSKTIEVEIRDSKRGPQIAPAHSAVGLRGAIRVVNRSAETRVVSCPEADWLARVETGEAVTFRPSRPGGHTISLLSSNRDAASIFVAPGPFSVVSRRGYWELVDISPGTWELRTWHARFPSTHKRVKVAAGAVTRLDLEVSTHAPDEDSP